MLGTGSVSELLYLIIYFVLVLEHSVILKKKIKKKSILLIFCLFKQCLIHAWT